MPTLPGQGSSLLAVLRRACGRVPSGMRPASPRGDGEPCGRCFIAETATGWWIGRCRRSRPAAGSDAAIRAAPRAGTLRRAGLRPVGRAWAAFDLRFRLIGIPPQVRTRAGARRRQPRLECAAPPLRFRCASKWQETGAPRGNCRDVDPGEARAHRRPGTARRALSLADGMGIIHHHVHGRSGAAVAKPRRPPRVRGAALGPLFPVHRPVTGRSGPRDRGRDAPGLRAPRHRLLRPLAMVDPDSRGDHADPHLLRA